MLNDAVRRIFRSKVFAHLALVTSDGAPHVSPVWVDVSDDDEIWFNTAEGRVKAKVLQEGTPVALSATNLDNPYEFAMVRGRVKERRHDTADADIDALAKKYLDADSYPFRQEGEQRVTIVVEPESTFPPS